jgi:cytochrome c peroxidase
MLYNCRFIFLLVTLISFGCCEPTKEEDLIEFEYNPVSYNPDLPSYFPKNSSPSDNLMTIQGIELGRGLFFDKILSKDNKMSCASCHIPEKAFTDGLRFSPGVDGIVGNKSSMSLVNVGFSKNGLFWDGRSKTLEDQALLPVEDEIELHTTWPEVIKKIQVDERYKKQFRAAFGIKNSSEISKELVAKALSQYQRAIISSNSKFDRVKRGEEFFTDLELMGFSLYTDVPGDDLPDAECHHCHQLDLATSDAFLNNGLQGAITKNISDNGKMKTPTLRNVTLSAPYMHDGSIKTLEEVIEHYNSGGKDSPNKDPLIRQLKLTNLHKRALIAFLNTLTDTSYMQNKLIVQ